MANSSSSLVRIVNWKRWTWIFTSKFSMKIYEVRFRFLGWNVINRWRLSGRWFGWKEDSFKLNKKSSNLLVCINFHEKKKSFQNLHFLFAINSWMLKFVVGSAPFQSRSISMSICIFFQSKFFKSFLL